MEVIEIAKALLLGYHKCKDCGVYGPNKDDDENDSVTWDWDPYASDIDGDHTKHWQCNLCREISADEI